MPWPHSQALSPVDITVPFFVLVAGVHCNVHVLYMIDHKKIPYDLTTCYMYMQACMFMTCTCKLALAYSVYMLSCYQHRYGMEGRVCGALVQFGCYQHKHK